MVSFSLLWIYGCTENRKSQSDNIEELLYNYHFKNSGTKKTKENFKILILKTIDDNYTGVFYKIKNDHYYSFIHSSNKIISVSRIKENDGLSYYDNDQCFVMFEKGKKKIIAQENDYCFTIFIGKVPTDLYSHIEIEWNCLEKSNQELIENKYFFFFTNNAGDQICNLKLKNEQGEVKKLAYDNLNQKLQLAN